MHGGEPDEQVRRGVRTGLLRAGFVDAASRGAQGSHGDIATSIAKSLAPACRRPPQVGVVQVTRSVARTRRKWVRQRWSPRARA